MDEAERAARRLRQRERRRLLRLQQLAPLVLVGAAMLLSTGLVTVMEVPHESARQRPPANRSARSLLAPDLLPEITEMLSVSILDEIASSREGDRPRSEELAMPPVPRRDDGRFRGTSSQHASPRRMTAAPEPGTAILLGGGLVWLAAIRRFRAAPHRR